MQLYLCRHGETEWALQGRHTGRSDPPLTGRGEENAKRLGERLRGKPFRHVFTSPSQRARRTCEIAGFGSVAQIDPDLAEWDYGQYEGLTSQQIRQLNPDWRLFRDGCPSGESVQQISARAERVVARLRAITTGDILIFSSGHFLRVLAARWTGAEAAFGKHLLLSTAALSMLGHEHANRDEPAICLWNDTSHTVG